MSTAFLILLALAIIMVGADVLVRAFHPFRFICGRCGYRFQSTHAYPMTACPNCDSKDQAA